MAATLLIGSHTGAWREWLKEHLAGRDFLCLDPADSHHGFPCRASLHKDGKPAAWRFIGSLSASRSPHVVLAALAELLKLADDPVVELFPLRQSPLLLQTARLCAAMIQPERIFTDRKAPVEPSGWPVAFEPVDLPAAAPTSVLAGQRKARWLQMLEQCEVHEVNLREAALDGLRLGSGSHVPIENLKKWGFKEPLHAEVSNGTLLIVCEGDVEDLEVTRALDAVHASKATVVSPSAYENRVCAFSRENGDDFGMGRTLGFDFREQIARVQCTAIAPTSVPTLKVGGLKLDENGMELGEARAWDA